MSLDQFRAAAAQPAATAPFDGRTGADAGRRVATRSTRQLIGRVLAVNGSQATVGLLPAQAGASDDARATVGKFLSIRSGKSLLIGMITDVSVDVPATARDKGFDATAKLDLMGEIMRDAAAARASSAASPTIPRSATASP